MSITRSTLRAHRLSLEGAVGRSGCCSRRAILPPELPEWVESLAWNNIMLDTLSRLRIPNGRARLHYGHGEANDRSPSAVGRFRELGARPRRIAQGERTRHHHQAVRAALTTVGESIALLREARLRC